MDSVPIKPSHVVCGALKMAMGVVGGRWKIVLVYILFEGSKRFSDLQKETGISRRMLTVNLRTLEEMGLVLRICYPETPPRVEYKLTEDGIALRPLIDSLYSWGQKFMERKKTNAVAKSIPSLVE